MQGPVSDAVQCGGALLLDIREDAGDVPPMLILSDSHGPSLRV